MECRLEGFAISAGIFGKNRDESSAILVLKLVCYVRV